MSRKKKRWRYTAGTRPYSVTVEELEAGGNIYVRIWRPEKQDHQYRSLRHKDKKRARRQADELALKRQLGDAAPLPERITLSRLLRLYMRHRSPLKGREAQGEDRRREKLFSRFLGATRDPRAISLAEWERFIALRRTGAINGRGEEVRQADRKSVGDRTIEADLIWLRAVLNWGTKWRVEGGVYLLPENPARGYPMPREKNPKRPVATLERTEAIRAAAPQVMMRTVIDGKLVNAPSYLSELIELAAGTGRRVSAILNLRYSDLRLSQGPHGSILWPADTDKGGRETLVPISPVVRAAIDRVMQERPGIGEAYLFPSPKVPGKPVRYETSRQWLLEAERLAGLATMKGSSWHAYRRAWATARKHMPDVDVAAAGGWKNAITLKTVYQQADVETMLRVVLEGTGSKAG